MDNLHILSEDSLVASLKKGDPAAFSYLYDNYASSLYSFIREIIDDEDAAGDVLKQLFLSVWELIEQYNSSKLRLFTWLLNMAREHAIEQLKIMPQAGLVSARPPGPQLTRFRNVTERLKKEHRVLIDLAYFQGYSVDEIAAIEDISIDVVKEELSQGLIHFCTYLR